MDNGDDNYFIALGGENISSLYQDTPSLSVFVKFVIIFVKKYISMPCFPLGEDNVAVKVRTGCDCDMLVMFTFDFA